MIWALQNKLYEIEIQAFEEEIGAFDTLYFGYVKILTYRTWAFFTKTQIEHIKTLFKMTPIKTKLTNYTSGVHFSKTKAKENKYYLNTWLFHFVSCYPKEQHRNMNSNFFSDYLFKRWKTAAHWNWYLSDREEVVFNEKVFFTQKKLGKMLLFSKYPAILDECDSLTSLMGKLCPAGVDKNFLNEFRDFFIKHKFRKEMQHHNYQINEKLIDYCGFLTKIFSKNEIISFKVYKKLICFMFANPKVFDRIDERFEHWTYCFQTLAGTNRISSFLKWQFYSGHLKKMAVVLKEMETLNLPYSRHKDPVYAFNFYSKRYCQTEQPNFSFLNVNKNSQNSISNKLINEDKELFCLKKVIEFNELISIGAQLHNCAGNQETIDYYLDSLNFTVTDKRDRNLYLGSVKRGRLEQLKGFKNSAPPKDLFDLICGELKKQNIIHEAPLKYYSDICVQSFR